MNLKVISRNVGFALLASAFFMFLSILVSVANGNDSALAALLISFIITFTVGIFPFFFVRSAQTITLKDGYMIIFLSWTLSFIFGMLPYLLWGGPFSVINSFFESVSGYTTFGGTILENIEALPDSLLFWRSSTHFIGGLGVVVFLLLIIPSSSPVRLRLTNLEISSLSREGYRARTNKTVIIYSSVYLVIFAASFLSYWIAGMSPFDAVNHAFSVTATGGFSTRNMSIASFDSTAINIVSIVFMFIASIHFGTLFMTVATRSIKPLGSPILKYYVLTVMAGIIGLTFSIKSGPDNPGWNTSLMQGAFQTVSYISTTGFAIGDDTVWHPFAKVVTLFLMLQCGMAGSTVGGIKADRMFILFKSIAQQVRQVLHPTSINRIHIRNHILTNEEVYPHILFIGLFLVILGVSTGLNVLCGLKGENALFTAVSSLSNVGPSLGDLGNLGNYHGISAMGKFVMCMNTFIGRLEIYPVFAVIMMVFSRNNR